MRLFEKTPRFAQSFLDLTAACVRLADCHDCFAILACPRVSFSQHIYHFLEMRIFQIGECRKKSSDTEKTVIHHVLSDMFHFCVKICLEVLIFLLIPVDLIHGHDSTVADYFGHIVGKGKDGFLYLGHSFQFFVKLQDSENCYNTICHKDRIHDCQKCYADSPRDECHQICDSGLDDP